MEGNRILDVVTSPSDLKALSDEELSILACEIRERNSSRRPVTSLWA